MAIPKFVPLIVPELDRPPEINATPPVESAAIPVLPPTIKPELLNSPVIVPEVIRTPAEVALMVPELLTPPFIVAEAPLIKRPVLADISPELLKSPFNMPKEAPIPLTEIVPELFSPPDRVAPRKKRIPAEPDTVPEFVIPSLTDTSLPPKIIPEIVPELSMPPTSLPEIAPCI